MTLQPWIKDISWQRPSVATMRVTGSRFCPICLGERGGQVAGVVAVALGIRLPEA